ncbi:MAG: hypothetical protein VW518_10830, partial [Burkholderiaceae bacterium]
ELGYASRIFVVCLIQVRGLSFMRIPQIFIWSVLWGGTLACTTPPQPPSFGYPTSEALRVREVCAELYTDAWWGYFSPSRKSALRSFRPDPAGLIASFSDGRSYDVPLQTGLPLGTYYCGKPQATTPCASQRDWDSRCEYEPRRQVPRIRDR